tara:strand:- start:192 stop:296 length:105 start_codon:yes stop_codon:yes gene_type:complete
MKDKGIREEPQRQEEINLFPNQGLFPIIIFPKNF